MAKILFPEHEMYLLENWTDVVELETSIESVRETYKGILESVLKRVADGHKELDSQCLHLTYGGGYSLNLGFGKKAWSRYPDWPTGIWLSNLWLENLTSEDEEHPSACVYVAPEKSTLDLEDASNLILNEAKRLLPTEQVGRIESVSKKSQAWVAWSLPESRRELLDLLKNEEAEGFINRLVEHFETLMQFIPVMEKIFEGGKQSRK